MSYKDLMKKTESASAQADTSKDHAVKPPEAKKVEAAPTKKS
ncbi:MAG: hypothetical protein WAO69_12055 [Aestuariivita sp.]